MDGLSEEIVLFWITVFLYTAAFCCNLIGFGSGKEGPTRWGMRLLWAGFAVHTATGIARWIEGDHAPVTNSYELDLTGTWLTMLLFLSFHRARKAPAALGLVVVPVVFLVLGHGFLQWEEATPMGPAFQSPWLIVHVIFAWLSFGSYAVSAGAAFFLLRKLRSPEKPSLARLPSVDALDLMSYRFIVLGFINHAVMLASGAIWANNLWGRYWSWDALETWSLLSFLLYAFYLHARAFLGWRLARTAWIAAAGLLVLSISFWGVALFDPSMHPGP
jgi:cytochrome c-type biogenesis protein CcsB